MATFKDGLEAAAQYIESQIGPNVPIGQNLLLARIRRDILAIPEPSTQIVLVDGQTLEVWFELFKQTYPKGPRNHWSPAKKAFESAVKKRKHSPRTIIDGTERFARSGKPTQYIEAPAVFLNQDRFLTDFGPPEKTRGPTLFEIEREAKERQQNGNV